MKTFKQIIQENNINESVIRKGAVSSFGLKGRQHGNEAVRHFKQAKQSLNNRMPKRTLDQKIDNIDSYLMSLTDGMIELRNQIGAVSAQITSGFIT